jgi:hypothetical protein
VRGVCNRPVDFVLRVEVSEEIRTERCVKITDGHDRVCVCVCVRVCVYGRSVYDIGCNRVVHTL